MTTRRVGSSSDGDKVVVLHLLFYMNMAMDGEGVGIPEGEEAVMGGLGNTNGVVVLRLCLLYMDVATACPNPN